MKFNRHLTPLNELPREDAMTTDEFNAVLDKLKLSTNAAARLVGVNGRTARRWGSGEAPVPTPAGRFLLYLARARISPISVMETLAE